MIFLLFVLREKVGKEVKEDVTHLCIFPIFNLEFFKFSLIRWVFLKN